MDESLERNIWNILSMAQRARLVASGGLAVEQAAKSGQAKLMLIAEDAEKNSREKYLELADRYGIPYQMALSREKLGACLGKEYRAAAVLLDEGFGKSLMRLFGKREN